MGDVMATVTGRNAVEDVCDHCQRGFRRLRSQQMCPSCGCENVRESAMLAQARERAVMPVAKARRPRVKKESR